MMVSFLTFMILVAASSLLQVSFIPVPLGLIAILIWWLLRGTKHVIWLALTFSLCLAAVSDLPASAILLSVTLSLALFIFAKSFLPNRLWANLGSLIISVLTWEVSLVAVLKLTKIL